MQETSGVFVYVGLKPNTSFLRGLVGLDSVGHIETDIMMRTSVAGIFVAGDIRAHSVSQLTAVAGDGATCRNGYRQLPQVTRLEGRLERVASGTVAAGMQLGKSVEGFFWGAFASAVCKAAPESIQCW